MKASNSKILVFGSALGLAGGVEKRPLGLTGGSSLGGLYILSQYDSKGSDYENLVYLIRFLVSCYIYRSEAFQVRDVNIGILFYQ